MEARGGGIKMLFTAVTRFLFSLTRQTTKNKNANGTGKRFVRRGVENYTR